MPRSPSTPKAIARFGVFALACILMAPLQWALLTVYGSGPAAYSLPWLWHRLICRAFGITIRIEGTPHTKSQTIFVGNHISYLDIPAIGSTLRGSFVAKKDVASWPVFGILARLQQTGFIDRSRTAALTESSAMSAMLDQGKTLIIFPEGTSTDGREVLPFKSSLFSLMLGAQRKELIIQPFTLSMTLVDGHAPESQDARDLYSWHRDMDTDLGVHLWRFAKSRGAVITLHFHDALRAADYQDRKELAKICHKAVSEGLAEGHNHRILAPAIKEGRKAHV